MVADARDDDASADDSQVLHIAASFQPHPRFTSVVDYLHNRINQWTVHFLPYSVLDLSDTPGHEDEERAGTERLATLSADGSGRIALGKWANARVRAPTPFRRGTACQQRLPLIIRRH